MRLWSIHPSYLDSMGLVALWREGLLAKKVLEGNTVGYRNHPQLERFRSLRDPSAAMNSYLYQVLLESRRRGYSFDGSKIVRNWSKKLIPVTRGQLRFEFGHLLEKLGERCPERAAELEGTDPDVIRANPVFGVVAGEKEPWEKS